MIEDIQALVVKTFLLALVIIGVMLGLRHLMTNMSTELGRPAVLTDPAVDVLAGDVPQELKGLANRITPFTRVQVAFDVARMAGYYCASPSNDELASLRRMTGRRTFFCPGSDEGFKPGDRALLLHVSYPQGFVSGLELRTVTEAAAKRPELLAQAPLVVAAKGVEFNGLAQFVDFVVDRFDHSYHPRCYDRDEMDRGQAEYCRQRRETRGRLGFPRWDGKSVEAGKYESAVRLLNDTGFQCGPLASLAATSKGSPGEQETYAVRCDMKTFSGQALAATLQIDAGTSRPQTLDLEVGGERQVVPLTGKPVFEAPDTTSIMVRAAGGEIRTIELSMDASSRGHAVEKFPGMDAGSQRRIVAAVLVQMGTVVSTPNDPVRIPMLQKLDIASHMLARLGAPAVRLAEVSAGLPPAASSSEDEEATPVPEKTVDLSNQVMAALGLARCRLDMHKPDCLARYVAVRPGLRGILISAVDEVRGTLEDLPESSLARQRIALLDRQIAATR